jgi:hypothetical protein
LGFESDLLSRNLNKIYLGERGKTYRKYGLKQSNLKGGLIKAVISVTSVEIHTERSSETPTNSQFQERVIAKAREQENIRETHRTTQSNIQMPIGGNSRN